MTQAITVVIIAVSLAMDAFAVSVAAGVGHLELKKRHALKMAFFFGVFQAVMPVIGWLAGSAFKGYIESFDHWVAFGILSVIGCVMIYESVRLKDTESKSAASDPRRLSTLLVLAIATSIDALAVGVTISLITDYVIAAVATIGVVTFVMSYAGWAIGKKLGHIFENKIEILAGLALIAIGVKILLEHLLG